MPRSKNPKPQKQFASSGIELANTDDNDQNVSSYVTAEESGGEARTGRSLSLFNAELNENEDEAEDQIRNEDDKDKDAEKKRSSDKNVETKPEPSENKEDFSFLADKSFDKPENRSKIKRSLNVGSSPEKAKRSMNITSTNILSWLQKRFVLRDNARTSAAQVIRLYEKEFAGDSVAPLQSYQVGQLLRRIFPNLQRCKITIDGRRVWVYKHLGVKDNSSLKRTTSKEKEMDSGEENELPNNNFRMKNYSSSSIADDVNRSGKNSAILYNLLNPVDNNSPPQSTFRNQDLPKSCRDDSIIDWLQENYEYADGYFVKSLNVLKKYNQGRQTTVRYLSQVGRFIKHVFPHARHLRRSMKGGKREWVYHNIRPKDHTENDVWKGSKKNLYFDSSLAFDSRPSMVPLSKFSLKKPIKFELNDDFNGSTSRNQDISVIPEKVSHRKVLNDQTDDVANDFFYSEEASHSNHETKSHSIPSPDVSSFLLKNKCSPMEESSYLGILDQDTIECNTFNLSTRTATTPASSVGLSAEDDNKQTFDELTCENSELLNDVERDVSGRDEEAQDLSINSKESSTSKKRSFANISDGDSPEPTTSHTGSESSYDKKRTKKEDASLSQTTEHNYSFAHVVDRDLRVKSFIKPGCSKNSPNHSNMSGFSNLNYASNSRSMSPHLLQWEDLSMCDAHQYGWTLTPNVNNEIPTNFIEWVLFEGQLLRDGQRVFRELKIYDDWSVSIHAMGKKVHPDELGGITDLSRTKKSVAKVFATLAGARICRGLPALCLSDLSVHGVVVARTEIWSSRENNCEELRHRAINCQVLYNSNDDSCPKCHRVVRMHSQSMSTASGHNGYASKETRFSSRASGPV